MYRLCGGIAAPVWNKSGFPSNNKKEGYTTNYSFALSSKVARNPLAPTLPLHLPR